jgi:hypothetical protein
MVQVIHAVVEVPVEATVFKSVYADVIEGVEGNELVVEAIEEFFIEVAIASRVLLAGAGELVAVRSVADEEAVIDRLAEVVSVLVEVVVTMLVEVAVALVLVAATPSATAVATPILMHRRAMTPIRVECFILFNARLRFLIPYFVEYSIENMRNSFAVDK